MHLHWQLVQGLLQARAGRGPPARAPPLLMHAAVGPDPMCTDCRQRLRSALCPGRVHAPQPGTGESSVHEELTGHADVQAAQGQDSQVVLVGRFKPRKAGQPDEFVFNVRPPRQPPAAAGPRPRPPARHHSLLTRCYACRSPISTSSMPAPPLLHPAAREAMTRSP